MSTGNFGSRRRRKIFAALRERHGGACHWCGKPMSFETSDDPRSATIEHVVPKSEGGANEQSNLRLAHKLCNGDRSKPTPKRVRSPLYILAALL